MDRFVFRKEQGAGWKRIHRTLLLAETEEAAIRLDDVIELERRSGRSWHVASCAVNLAIVGAEGRKVADIVRYDTAHGFPHRDELFRNPPEKVRLPVTSAAELRAWALRDLQANWRRYLAQYFQAYGQTEWTGGRMNLKKALAKLDATKVDQRLEEYIDATAQEDPNAAPEFALYLPLAPEASKFFTKERLRLLCFLRDHGSRSMTDLAEALARNADAVSRDVRFLVNMGVLALERDSTDGRRKVVRLCPGELRMTLGSR